MARRRHDDGHDPELPSYLFDPKHLPKCEEGRGWFEALFRRRPGDRVLDVLSEERVVGLRKVARSFTGMFQPLANTVSGYPSWPRAPVDRPWRTRAAVQRETRRGVNWTAVRARAAIPAPGKRSTSRGDITAGNEVHADGHAHFDRDAIQKRLSETPLANGLERRAVEVGMRRNADEHLTHRTVGADACVEHDAPFDVGLVQIPG